MSYIQIASASDVIQTDLAILSGGQKLQGRLFRPVRAPRAVAIINAATAVRQRFYRPFAEWLVSQGIACLTYDYRDFGSSARGPMRQSNATMLDWGIHDAQAARDAARAHLPDSPVWVIGHSLGGLLLSYQKDLDQIERAIGVASGFVHVSEHPWPYQALARFFWYGGGPLSTSVAGYLPGKRLGFGQDLPTQVYWQWRALCTRRDFASTALWGALPPEDLRGFSGELRMVAVEDDVMVPPKAVWKVMQRHHEARKTQATLRPAAYGLRKIGHIGVFDPASSACWPDIIAD
ncbi:putative alpha/beta hydrolase [Litoreibacter ponti]|uniref:Putative alpha/beta hydrolase n=1 Tax=Litoreibacter ponti TaxID=1510457 RepID=A0A2T6BFP3_9RHOB|nr:alpha/beta fold hydrolase [Litoreibacter ponti]PTX54876.1 putative alpha/beta hydrolase [Litoreibacter ponti]